MLVVCAKYLSMATMSSPSSVWCLVFCGFDGKENKQELYKTYQNQFGDTSNILCKIDDCLTVAIDGSKRTNY